MGTLYDVAAQAIAISQRLINTLQAVVDSRAEDRRLISNLVHSLPTCDAYWRVDTGGVVWCCRPAMRHTGGPDGDAYCDKHAVLWEQTAPPDEWGDPCKTVDEDYAPALRELVAHMEEWGE